MKTTLIRLPNFHLYDETQQPPLGILYLAAYLEKHDCAVDVCDLAAIQPWAWESLLPMDSDIYGITCTSPDYPMAKRMLALLRKIRPNAEVIIGGIHPTVMPETCVADGFDAAFIGEGEQSLLEWVTRISPMLIDGLCFQGRAGIVRTKKRALLNINTFPFPARHLLPLDHVVSDDLVTDNATATVITTSRGCPMKCSFCANGKGTVWDGTWRMRSVENIAAELRHIRKDYNVQEIRLVDDMVGAKRGHIAGISQAMAETGFQWRCHLRVDTARPEDLLLMKQSGCIEVSFGIESASPKVLKHNHKGYSEPGAAYEAVRCAKAVGLRVRAYFIIGLPGEDRISVRQTEEMIGKLECDAVNIFSFIPYYGCDIQQNPQNYDFHLIDDDLEHYWMLSNEHYFVGRTAEMSILDLDEAFKRCWEVARSTGKAKWIRKQKESGDGDRRADRPSDSDVSETSAAKGCVA